MNGPSLGKDAERVIVALGDSTTAGTPGFDSPLEAPPAGRGEPKSQYAYWVMQKHPEWRVINQGIKGQRTDEILKRFDRDVAAFHPDTVIVLAGVNDLFQGKNADSVIRNLQAIYDKAQALKIRIAACTILPFDGMEKSTFHEMQKANRWIKENAEAQNFIFCDTFGLLEDPAHPGRLIESPDGYHPSAAGYQKMGELIAVKLE